MDMFDRLFIRSVIRKVIMHSDIKCHMTLNNICIVVIPKYMYGHFFYFLFFFLRTLTTSNFNRKINSSLDTRASCGSLLNHDVPLGKNNKHSLIVLFYRNLLSTLITVIKSITMLCGNDNIP